MNNKEFISELSTRVGRSAKETQSMVVQLIAEMTDQLEDNNLIVAQGFGTFEVKKKTERVMVNPSTGQRMLVPPKLVISFKSSNMLKDSVQKGGDE